MRVQEILEHDVGAGLPKLIDRVAARRDGDRHRARDARAFDVVRRIADDNHAIRLDIGDARLPGAFHGDRNEIVPVGRVAAKCAAWKVLPQVEVFQLDARPIDEIPGQQRERHVVPPLKRIEQRTDARHHVLHARPRQLNLLRQVGDVPPAQPIEQRLVERLLVLAHHVSEDAPVRAAGELHTRHRVVGADDVGAGAVHGAPSGSAGQHERPVNIEKNEIHYASEAE